MACLIVDGNNIGCRAWMANDKLGNGFKTSMGVPTTVTFGLLRSIDYALSNNNGIGKIEKCFITWDKGSEYRKRLFKHYKGTRERMDNYESLLENYETAQKYLAKLGIPQIYRKGMEADDIIGFLTRKLNKVNGKGVIIFSDDVDFHQLLKHRVRQFRPSSQNLVTSSDFVEEYGMKPKHYPRLLALIGQQKDNIPGACDVVDGVMKKFGFGVKTALKCMFDEDGNVKKLKQIIEEFPDNRFRENIIRNRKQVFLSLKLSKVRCSKKEYDKDEWKDLNKMFTDGMLLSEVKLSKVRMVSEFLEIKKTNVPAILKKIGIKIT